MEASDVKVLEKTPASQKLQAGDAENLLRNASKLIVAKGKKLSEFKLRPAATAEAVQAMLGPTGNLRAPTLRIGKTLMVGYNEEAFERLFN